MRQCTGDYMLRNNGEPDVIRSSIRVTVFYKKKPTSVSALKRHPD